MNRASLVVIISNNNNDNNINNNVSRQISESTLASCELRFIYENNKRNRNYALSDPRFPLLLSFPLCEALCAWSPTRFPAALWHAYNLHVPFAALPASIFMSCCVAPKDVLCNLETIHEAICAPAPAQQQQQRRQADIDLAYVCGHWGNGKDGQEGGRIARLGMAMEMEIEQWVRLWEWQWATANGGQLKISLSPSLYSLLSSSLCFLACLAAFIDLNWVICNKTRSQVGGWVKILLQINDANLCMSPSWNWEIIRKIDLIFLGAK